MKHKLLSVLTAFCLVLTLLPIAALAAEDETPTVTAENGYYKVGETYYAEQDIQSAWTAALSASDHTLHVLKDATITDAKKMELDLTDGSTVIVDVAAGVTLTGANFHTENGNLTLTGSGTIASGYVLGADGSKGKNSYLVVAYATKPGTKVVVDKDITLVGSSGAVAIIVVWAAENATTNQVNVDIAGTLRFETRNYVTRDMDTYGANGAVFVRNQLAKNESEYATITIKPTANISGGHGTSGNSVYDDGPAIHIGGYAKLVVEGGTLTGDEAIDASDAKVDAPIVISGGTLNGTDAVRLNGTTRASTTIDGNVNLNGILTIEDNMMYFLKEGFILRKIHHDCGSFAANEKQL